jgi:hypothetical protein
MSEPPWDFREILRTDLTNGYTVAITVPGTRPLLPPLGGTPTYLSVIPMAPQSSKALVSLDANRHLSCDNINQSVDVDPFVDGSTLLRLLASSRRRPAAGDGHRHVDCARTFVDRAGDDV